jgi:LysM repeat protein
MYGIEKKYGVSGEDLRRANPFIEEEAQMDKPSGKKQNNKYSCSSSKVYDVLPKETKYSISRFGQEEN